ncbi:MAG: hypothetical protein ACI4EY_08845 [Lachnospiraceae bacterium]
MSINNNWQSQLFVDEINRQSDRDNAIKETRDLLLKMQEDSERESKINRRRFWISLIVSLIAAIAAVISALPYILT